MSDCVARGQITFHEAQKGEDTLYLRLSPSTLSMSNQRTAEDISLNREWWRKYRASLRLMRGDTNVSGSITAVKIYDSSNTLIYDSTASSQPAAGDVRIAAVYQTVVNPITQSNEEHYLLNFTKFDTIAPCECQFDIYVTASVLDEPGSSRRISFNDHIFLTCVVEDTASLIGLEYLKAATSDGKVTQEGGLILSNAIALGEWENDTFIPWAGMSGIFDEGYEFKGQIAPGKSIAAWYGGDMIDYENLTAAERETERYAQSLFRMDGSGYLAGGGISWDESGNLIIDGSVKLTSSSGDTLTEFIGVVTNLNNMFELVNVGTEQEPEMAIKALYPLFSDSWITALGVGPADSGGGGGGGADLSDVWSSLMTNSITDAYYDRKIHAGHLPISSVCSTIGNVVTNVEYEVDSEGAGKIKVTKGTITTTLEALEGADNLRVIESLNGTGLLKKTGNNTWTFDTNSYLTTTSAAALYATKASLNDYLTIADAAITYATKAELPTFYNLFVKDSADNQILVFNASSADKTLKLTKGLVGLDRVENIPISSYAKIVGNTISIGEEDLTLPAWALDYSILTNNLSSVFHPLGGDSSISLAASTITASSSMIIGNNNPVNARLYFGGTSGSSYGVFEMVELSGGGYALHSSLPIYSDSWIAALEDGSDTAGGSGDGGIEHVLLSQSEFDSLTVIDDGKIYMVYEDA